MFNISRLNKYIIIIIFLSFSLSACRREEVSETKILFNTYCSITVWASQRGGEEAIRSAFERMGEVESKFNIHSETSPLYRFNREGGDIEDDEIANVVKEALEIAGKSKGAFDPSVYPLLEVWGIYGEGSGIPEEKQIEKALKKVGYDNISIENGRVYSAVEGLGIDLGGIAKGYAVDEGIKELKRAGIDSALIDAGGDIYALGSKNGREWRIGLQNPRGEGNMSVFKVSDRAVVTSGDYHRYFEEGGDRYHHIIDPQTGYPSEEVVSATVIGPKAMTADGWATAVMVMGVREGLEAIKEMEEYEVFMITSEGEAVSSQGLDKYGADMNLDLLHKLDE